MTHIRGCQLIEGGVARALPSEGIGRLQAPVLAAVGEGVGRRADRTPSHQLIGIGPALRAIGSRSDGQIAIEAKPETALAPLCLGAGKLALTEPLQKEVKPLSPRVFKRKHLKRGWISPRKV